MSEEKKITVVLESLSLGGSERQAIYLADGLANEGYDVNILAIGVSGNAESWIERLGIPYQNMNLQLYTHAPHIIKKNKKELIQHFKKHKPFAVIPFTYWPNFYCNWVYTKARIQKCFWNQRDMGLKFGKHKSVGKILSKASHVIGNSTSCLLALREFYLVESKDSSVIYNGVLEEFYENDYTVTESGSLNAVMIANIQKNKDHETLIRSWAILKKRLGEDCPKLNLAGAKRDTYENLSELIEELQLGELVIFNGMVNDVHELILNMDFAVFSSNAEGSPNGLLETIAGGLPVVATDIPAISEILGDEYDYLVKMNSPDDFAKKVMDLMGKGEKMIEVSKTNRMWIRNSYNMDAMVDSYIKLIEA